MSVGIGERVGSEHEQQLRAQENMAAKIRVAVPGIIQEVDLQNQTVTVQPTIREKVIDSSGGYKMMELPMLLDVPMVFPKAGGFSITFPVKKGDECLVIFADMCIDAWWQSGEIQNQLEIRRHDLSDGFALLGVSSIPNVVTNYSPNSLQIRNKSGNAYIEIKDDDITIKGRRVTTIQTGG